MDFTNNHLGRIQELDGQPAVRYDESANHRCMLTLLGVAVGNFDAIVPIHNMLPDSVGDEYRSMPPASATDRNGDIGFAFLLILRKKKVDERVYVIQKLPGLVKRVHIFDDAGMRSRMRFQIRHEI